MSTLRAHRRGHHRGRRLLALSAAAALVFGPIVLTPPAASAAPAAIPGNTVGVTAVTTTAAPNNVQVQEFTRIKQNGFTTVRLPIQWPEVEYNKGTLDWAATDRIVNNAANAGLKILGVATYVPGWAATPEGRNFLHPAPADPALFANFVKLAAQRYKNTIGYWEIWNEPNIAASFAPNPDPYKYSQMLRLSYNAIKAVNPAAVVLTGGTSPAADDGTNISPAMFIQTLYFFGAKNTFDAIAVHPYSGPNLLSNGADWSGSRTAISVISWLMLVFGDSNKKIWATEFGATTTPGNQYGVTEARQAEILVDAIAYLRSLPNAGPIFLFDHRDLGTGNANPEYNFGLVRTDYSPKPALAAVRRVLVS